MLFRKRRFIALTFVAVLLTTAALMGRWTDVRAEPESYEDLKIFTEVLSVIDRNYVEEVDTKELVQSAIRGMLSSLDPHSSFLTKRAYKEVQVDTKGEFGGLGIQISIKKGVLTVISPIEDTPAWRIGIKAGDKIIKIEDETTKDMTIFDAVGKMRGPKGTSVTISILRKGWTKLKDFTIVRDVIRIQSVKHRLIDGTVGYVKLLQFQRRTANDLSDALQELRDQDIEALVLDLRNNPGGLLQSAVDVSGKFLPEGKLVVYIKGRTGRKSEYKTRGGKHITSIPMVVLVNQGSASASEIVAGALKDWNRAIILGTKTFGKGSVQSIVPLTDGSGLRLTTSRYYTPKGTSIQNTGIEPDIVVKIEAKEGAVEHPIIREKDLKGHLDNDTKVEAPDAKDDKEKAVITKVDEEDDTQLKRAVDLLKTWNVFKQLPEDEPTQE